ncbi:MAG: response regulator transcription factor [Gammaproteobacteria bacterium]|nr:response regulator transcription factor [Gammaproteobacteria bacterium]
MDSSVALQVLVVDNDQQVRDLIADLLHRLGHSVCTLADGQGLSDHLLAVTSFIVLNLHGAEESGLALYQRIRQRYTTPMLMLIKEAELASTRTALTCGFADVLLKPFSASELLTSMRQLLRHAGHADADPRIGRWRFNGHTQQLHGDDGQLLQLTSGEATLLIALLARRGEVVSRHYLATHLTGAPAVSGDRAIDVQISRLRRRLGDGHGITTIRSQGYRLDHD